MDESHAFHLAFQQPLGKIRSFVEGTDEATLVRSEDQLDALIGVWARSDAEGACPPIGGAPSGDSVVDQLGRVRLDRELRVEVCRRRLSLVPSATPSALPVIKSELLDREDELTSMANAARDAELVQAQQFHTSYAPLPRDPAVNDIAPSLRSLADGPHALDAWRRKHPGQTPNFFGADLMYLDLREVDLSGADLRNANLNGCDLRGADLRGASLLGADLSETRLEGADLRDANLAGASLFGSRATDCRFEGASLLGADFRHADLRGSGLSLEQAQEAGAWCEDTVWPRGVHPRRGRLGS